MWVAADVRQPWPRALSICGPATMQSFLCSWRCFGLSPRRLERCKLKAFLMLSPVCLSICCWLHASRMVSSMVLASQFGDRSAWKIRVSTAAKVSARPQNVAQGTTCVWLLMLCR
jgi:hypothetical protein